MPATYKSNLIGADSVYTPPAGGQCFVREVTFEAKTALGLNDVIQMIPVFKGERVVDLEFFSEDLDTGTTIVIDVGDGEDPDRYIDGTTVPRTGGHVRLGSGVATSGAAAFALGDYTYPADDTIDVLVAAAPTGGGLGKIKLRATIVAP